jgi:hypothetical protein
MAFTFRLIGSEKIWERDAARTSRLQSLETELLAEEENLAGLARINRESIGSRSRARRWCLGADGACAKPGIYEELGERGPNYAIRLPANHCVERDLAELLTRPVGRPCRKPVLRFYNKRGTAQQWKQWIKEGQQAVKMTRLSCQRFRSNEVRLWLSVIAYNLGNLWQRLVLPQRVEKWSLTSFEQRLVKTGGRLFKHARYYWLLLAEGHLTRRLFGAMVRPIAALPVPAR